MVHCHIFYCFQEMAITEIIYYRADGMFSEHKCYLWTFMVFLKCSSNVFLNVTFECSQNILKQVVTFKKHLMFAKL